MRWPRRGFKVSLGKQHTSVHAKAALRRLLDELGDKRPAMVRGDSGYGNEGILLELEGRGQPYLLRLRQTANVQRLVARQFARQDWSRADHQGCQRLKTSCSCTAGARSVVWSSCDSACGVGSPASAGSMTSSSGWS